MQSTEFPGQQREKETGYIWERQRENFSLSGRHVHLATRETSLLDVCRVHMGGAHCQPPVHMSTSRRNQRAVLKKKIQLCSSN